MDLAQPDKDALGVLAHLWHETWMAVGSLFGGFTNWWNTLNIGNLSEALAALGAFAAVTVTLGLTRRDAKQSAYREVRAQMLQDFDRRSQRRANAEQVTISCGKPVFDDTQNSIVMEFLVKNAGPTKIYHVEALRGPGDDMALMYNPEALADQPTLADLGELMPGEEKAVRVGLDKLVHPGDITLKFRDVHEAYWVNTSGALHDVISLTMRETFDGAELRAIDSVLLSSRQREQNIKIRNDVYYAQRRARRIMLERVARESELLGGTVGGKTMAEALKAALRTAASTRSSAAKHAPETDPVTPQPTPPAPPATAPAAAPPDPDSAS